MINEVSIQYYKCFHDTKIEGFERVNLIGGLNNSGKTVLLEALHLCTDNFEGKLRLHRKLRGESDDTNNLEYLFYKSELGNAIYVEIDDNEKLQILKEGSLKSKYDRDHSLLTHLNRTNAAQFNIQRSSVYYPGTEKYELIDNFITPSEPFNSEQLVQEYNKAEDRQQEHRVIEFLKIIDKTITDIRVSIQGGAHLRVKKGNEGVMPLTALGDAAKKVVRIALSILNGDHKVIFVDEIENGIHYTAHREFWRLLFHIAETLDVQVFATTHSLEMIKAYHEVASNQGIKDATYFELFRNGKTSEIQGRKMDMEKLEYKLERNLELRGE